TEQVLADSGISVHPPKCTISAGLTKVSVIPVQPHIHQSDVEGSDDKITEEEDDEEKEESGKSIESEVEETGDLGVRFEGISKSDEGSKGEEGNESDKSEPAGVESENQASTNIFHDTEEAVLELPAEGASRTKGGIMRGQATGNVFSMADGDDVMPGKMKADGLVKIYKSCPGDINELFVSPSMWHSHVKTLAKVSDYPAMQAWLEGGDNAPDDEEVWGYSKISYHFKDLNEYLKEQDSMRGKKGKGKVAQNMEGDAKKSKKRVVEKGETSKLRKSSKK
ncbi:hypothetical protein APHAL10511_008251, partial [Amanita phalloides]